MQELDAVFSELKAILASYAPLLDVKTDAPAEYYLDTTHVFENGKPLFFGAVQVRKSTVSFHLMPVYVEPGLLEGLSPGLKRRMQGKSCFNFAAVDKPLFEELTALTRAGFASYEAKGYVRHREPRGVE